MVTLISDISDQVNLLALNAFFIEVRRAEIMDGDSLLLLTR